MGNFQKIGMLVLTLFMTVFSLAFPLTNATAADHGALFSYGDSGIDTGNLAIALGGEVHGYLQWEGRFCNGPNYLDAIAEAVAGWSSDPALNGGYNYSFGGAGISKGWDPEIPLLAEQIMLSTEKTIDHNDMVLVSIGVNDLLSVGTGIPDDPAVVAAELMSGIETLADIGARQLIIPTLYPLHLSPGVLVMGSETMLYARRWLITLNMEVDRLLASFVSRNPDIKIIRPDFFKDLTYVYNNPGEFGFTNITDSAFDGSSVVDNPNDYLWWDEAHSTKEVQKLMAKWLLAEVVSTVSPHESAPQAGLALLDMNLAHSRQMKKNISRRLFMKNLNTTAGRGNNTKHTVFASPYGVWGGRDSQGVSSAYDWNTAGIDIGYEISFTPQTMAGISFNISEGQLDIDDNNGDGSSTMMSVDAYGSFGGERFYSSSGVSYLNADNNGERTVSLLDKTGRYDFTSEIVSAWIEAGWHHPVTTNTTVTPLANIEFDHMQSNECSERNAGLVSYDNINYGNRNFVRHMLGARMHTEKNFRGTFQMDLGLTAGWHHEYGDSQWDADTRLAGQQRKHSIEMNSDDSFYIGVSPEITIMTNGKFGLTYDADIFSESIVQSLTADFSWSF